MNGIVNDWKFRRFSYVKHSKGTVYYIIGYGKLEKSWEDCYVYCEPNKLTLICRSKQEMEDGRFEQLDYMEDFE
jgi:hypothetical protein